MTSKETIETGASSPGAEPPAESGTAVTSPADVPIPEAPSEEEGPAFEAYCRTMRDTLGITQEAFATSLGERTPQKLLRMFRQFQQFLRCGGKRAAMGVEGDGFQSCGGGGEILVCHILRGDGHAQALIERGELQRPMQTINGNLRRPASG